MIRPKVGAATPIFGENQTSLGDVASNRNVEIPKDSKFVFKSRALDGTEIFHYETPDGRIVSSNRELDLGKGERAKAKNFSGYQGPTPTPNMRKRGRKL